MNDNLERFKIKQRVFHEEALKELRNGRKETHWMWFIFPQILGLGHSFMAEYYSVKSVVEAIDYVNDSYLMNNYLELCHVLLELKTDDPMEVFGDIDAMKLKSSLTLFYIISEDEIIKQVLDKYFNGELDVKTLKLTNIIK